MTVWIIEKEGRKYNRESTIIGTTRRIVGIFDSKEDAYMYLHDNGDYTYYYRVFPTIVGKPIKEDD